MHGIVKEVLANLIPKIDGSSTRHGESVSTIVVFCPSFVTCCAVVLSTKLKHETPDVTCTTAGFRINWQHGA